MSIYIYMFTGDHDVALSYLMDHYPELLPSYSGLSDEERG